ncbi:hypothetical protein O1L60_36455 [Streptomyces diastatochromogenes]|nr:hypothetical protein [Streptomyces diastatochromogenes]
MTLPCWISTSLFLMITPLSLLIETLASPKATARPSSKVTHFLNSLIP